MKQINKHNSDLISIYPIRFNEWGDKIIFKKIIKILVTNHDRISFLGQRAIKFKFTKPKIDKENIFFYDEECNDIIFSFEINSHLYNKELETYLKLWEEYEHASILLSNNNIFLDKSLLRKNWKGHVLNRNSIYIFKGIEENVIWIGKNNLLEFPNLDEIKTFSPKLSP